MKAKTVIDLNRLPADRGVASGITARMLRDLADRIEGHPNFSEGHSQPLLNEVEEAGYFSIVPDGID